MLIDFQMKQLKQSHLILLQKHIELGPDHLKSLISSRGLEELCALDLLDPKTEKEVKLGPEELTGTITSSFNSFLTTALGAWMGLNGLGLTLNSKVIFQTFIVISSIVGAAVGISNHHITKKQIQNRINQRKLQDIELDLLNLLNEMREQEILDKIEEIKQILKALNIGYQGELEMENTKELQESELCLKWLDRIEQLLEVKGRTEGSEVYELFKEDLEEMREKIGERLHIKQVQDENKKKVPPIFRPLLETPLPMLKKKKSWIRTNWLHLLRSGFPFLYGSFNSVFAYLATVRQISNQVGWTSAYAIVNDPRAKTIQLAIALCITTYFAISFFLTNRKHFKRDQEIDKAQNMLIKKQEVLNNLDKHLVKVKEVLAFLQRFAKIPEIAEILVPLKR